MSEKRRNRIIFTIVASVIIFLWASIEIIPVYLRKSAWKEDILAFEEHYNEYLDIFYNNPKSQEDRDFRENKEKMIKDLKRKYIFLDNEDIMIRMQKIIAEKGNGTPRSSYSSLSKTKDLPFEFKYFKDELWCIGTYLYDYIDMSNCKLIGINNFTVDEILERFTEYISYDNMEDCKNSVQHLISTTSSLRATNIISKRSYKLVYHMETMEGEAFDIEYDGKKPLGSIRYLYAKREEESNIPYGYYPSKNYYLMDFLEDNLLYMKINRGSFTTEEIKSIDKKIKKYTNNPETKKIIIDFRENDSGSFDMVYPWLDRLIKWNKETDGLYIIQDKTTLLAASPYIVSLKYGGKATIIGEASGGGVPIKDKNKSVRLPNSKFRLNLPTEDNSKNKYYLEMYYRYKEKNTIEPDIYIYPDINDYINKEDPLFNYIINL